MTNLKCLRILSELTQSEVEQASGVARWKISLAEAGRFSLSEPEISALAGVFDAKPSELLKKPKLGGRPMEQSKAERNK